MNGESTVSTRNKHPKKDIHLLVAILGLNCASGVTTIQGAMKVFSGLGGGLAGVSIQLMLFLLTSNSAASHAPKKKWTGVFVLSLVSIYTSFFSYDGQLASEARVKEALSRAQSEHNELVSEVFTPLKSRLETAESQVQSLWKQRDREISGDFRTTIPGNGQEARKIADSAIEMEKVVEELQPVVALLAPKFEYDPSNLTPEKILQKDGEALAAVPKNYLPQSYQSGLNRDDYIDSELRIELFAPINKVKRGEQSSVVALTIAFMVDGVCGAIARKPTLRL